MCFSRPQAAPPPPPPAPPASTVLEVDPEDTIEAKRKQRLGTRQLQIPLLPRGTGFDQGLGIPIDSLGIRG